MGLDMAAIRRHGDGSESSLHQWRNHRSLHGWLTDRHADTDFCRNGSASLTTEDIDEIERGSFLSRTDAGYGRAKEDRAFAAKAREALAAGDQVIYRLV
jgi:hypothetical protein